MNKYMKDYIKNGIKIDVNSRLIRNPGQKNHKALNDKLKSSSTRDTLGIENGTHRNWIK